MIKEAFDRLFLESKKARNQKFAGHSLASFIRNEVPGIFMAAFPGDSDLKWEGPREKEIGPTLPGLRPLIRSSQNRPRGATTRSTFSIAP